MKYYAVTEDPNELFHYGRLGMKWGQHIFGDKSPAFRRAAGKLRAIKAAVMKTPAQRDMSRVQRQQNRMQKKVARDQRRASKIRSINAANKKKEQTRANLVNAMATLDQEDSFRKQFNRDFRAAQKAQKYQRKLDNYAVKRDLIDQKNDVKTMRKSNKAERRLTRYTQLARKGKLKYGKLTEEQIQKVQDRLGMEQRTRQLGSSEKSYRQMRKEALRKGILQGIEGGTRAAMEEVARGIVKNKFANRHVLNKQSKQQAKRDKESNKIRNQKSHKEIRQDLKQEAYEAQVRSGESAIHRHNITATGAAKHLKEVEQKKLEAKNENDFKNAIKNAQNQEYVDYLKDIGQLNRPGVEKLDREHVHEVISAHRQLSAGTKENAYKQYVALQEKEHNERENERYKQEVDAYNNTLDKNNKLEAEYKEKLKKYKKKHADWVVNGQHGEEPHKPKKPELAMLITPTPPRKFEGVPYSLAEYEQARSLGLLSSGGGKPKKK